MTHPMAIEEAQAIGEEAKVATEAEADIRMAVSHAKTLLISSHSLCTSMLKPSAKSKTRLRH